ncbi:DUF3445 domain-containing protein [Nibrella saemangeumensis]|uniref:DUF3445 domain-containing protein n=1 Tax=Nibrella saemangeumensis TaxID=1084526 RepID=A0ABP8MWZ2_9BACT
MLRYFPFQQQFNDKMGTMLLLPTDPLIEADEHYGHEVQLKRRLLTEFPQYYYQSLPGYQTAQWEVLAMVLESLVQHNPEHFCLTRPGHHWHWQNRLLNEEVVFTFGDAASLPLEPLDWAGRQVQEDLLLLAGDEPHLVAGQLCFGNGWSLDEKLSLSFWNLHGPVSSIVKPMMQAAQKFMERLPAGRPVWRLNWSLKLTDQLDLTSRHTADLNQQLAELLPNLTPTNIGQHLFVRIERQTLTRLPQSGAILFGIHTYQNRLDNEAADPERALRIGQVVSTTPPAMLEYKGITPFLEPLLAYLQLSVRELAEKSIH